jgi:hypothetical protein
LKGIIFYYFLLAVVSQTLLSSVYKKNIDKLCLKKIEKMQRPTAVANVAIKIWYCQPTGIGFRFKLQRSRINCSDMNTNIVSDSQLIESISMAFSDHGN